MDKNSNLTSFTFRTLLIKQNKLSQNSSTTCTGTYYQTITTFITAERTIHSIESNTPFPPTTCIIAATVSDSMQLVHCNSRVQMHGKISSRNSR
ncbi:hypothetical protein CDAR_489621 [Caerostris darwini]|uniref:Uncharacterized protein n=1 Tax=Caerostris darwini TaxID=1538125 RepID=A0AAV4VJV5_9ARAC|nr:hypothetical protein CDAR_489621 [Caerostris darwini]